MRRQLQHKRFTTLYDASSSLRCHWYAQIGNSIEPMGNVYDGKNQRPESIFIQV